MKRTSLVDDVINHFLADVHEGLFGYGEKLPSQKELANRYQVSLIVLREALTKLSAVGMVRFHQGKGTYLNKPDEGIPETSEFSALIFHNVNNLRAIVEARQIVERETCYLAAARRTSKDISEIEKIINRMKDSFNNHKDLSRWDLEFHLAVAKASQNEALYKITVLLIDSYRPEVPKFFEVPGVVEKVLKEHEDIYRNIKNSNCKEASSIMNTHLQFPEKIFSTKMGDSDVFPF